MPAYSTLDLIYEVYEAIASMTFFSFTLSELVERMKGNREKRGDNRRVSRASVDRILNKLWLPLDIHKVSAERWEKGTSPMRGLTRVKPDIVEKVIRSQGIRATPMEIDHWIGLGEEPIATRAYICYPYRSNPLKHSIELLVLLIHLYPKANDSFAPATPHEMYWDLEGRISREIAMNECRKLILECKFLLNCQRRGEEPSSGMKRDMEVARANNIPIKYIEDEDMLGYYPDVNSIMVKSDLSQFVAISETPKPIIIAATSKSTNKSR